MINSLKFVFISVPTQVAQTISSGLYYSTQRLAALILMTNQRLNYSYSSLNELKNRRLTILSAPKQDALVGADKGPVNICVQITTSNKDVLEGILMVPRDRLETQHGKPRVRGRLMVAYCGIGGCYENWYFEGLKELYENFNTSILLVNYRGVGRSTGYITVPQDLLEDGYIVAQYAYNQIALDPHKIHFYGMSMGGAVAVNVVARLEKEGIKPASVCIDRSYSQLIQTIHCAMPLNLLKWFMSGLLSYTGWQIDSLQSVLKLAHTKVVVIRSETDSVIPSETSLATALQDQTEGKAFYKLIDLPSPEPDDTPSSNTAIVAYQAPAKTYQEQLAEALTAWKIYVKRILLGIKAHSLPFSIANYPIQVMAYEKVLTEAENRTR
jgi:alpha/beta superfamily hydrolase